jgi:hypothetical protein
MRVAFSKGKKFDLQLSQALIDERRLADIFAHSKIERVELKSESYQWERTGNICIEFASRGQPSGIAATEADYWVHELKRDGETLVYLMFPIERLKSLCRTGNRRIVHNAGDDGAQSAVILPLSEVLR